MSHKAIFVVCAQAVFIQMALSQCLGRGGVIGGGPYGLPYDGLAYDGLAYGAGCGLAAPAASGGGFAVTSASPIAPTGLYVVSENAIEGALAVGGQLPFLAAVALEGVFPTAGVGTISYGCGNGAVGITSEGLGAGPIVAAGPAYGPGLAVGAAYGPGLAAGPAYGPVLAAAGPVYDIGIGYNGFGGCGCGGFY